MSDVETIATEAPAAEPTIEEIAAKLFPEDTPAAPEAPKVAEVVADVPKTEPGAAKVSPRLEVARRAELRAAEARAEIAKARAEVDAARAEVAEKAKAVDAFMAAKLSPSKALELLGMGPKEFLETLATEHEPAAVAARAVAGNTSEVAKLQARIDALESAAKAKEEAAKAREADSYYDQATNEFVEFVGKSHEKYPALVAEFSDAEIALAGRNLLNEVVGKDDNDKPVTRLQAYMDDNDGVPPSDEEVAELLEKRAAKRAENRGAWHQRIGLGARPSKGISSGDQQVTQPEKGPSPRTLTSRAAGERATVAAPPTDEEIDAECIRMLQRGMSAG